MSNTSYVDHFRVKCFYSICCKAFTMYSAASVTKSSASSCCIPLGHKENNALSNNLLTGEWLAFSKTSHEKNKYFPGFIDF